MTDDWDERVDAVTRGLLGMTVGCARCHDHKFDPIPTRDYYGLVGVFASTMRAERPLFDVDPKIETRYLWIQDRLFDLRYSANLLTGEASTVVDSKPRVDRWKAEIETLKTEMLALQEKYPELVKSVEKYWDYTPRERRQAAGANADRRGRSFGAIVEDRGTYWRAKEGGFGFNNSPTDPGMKYRRALNIETGAVAWEIPQVGPVEANYSGVLSTAGGLVFYGETGGDFAAVDAKTGVPLWHFPANQRWKASPMTYSVNGKHVAIASGANILVFGLPK